MNPQKLRDYSARLERVCQGGLTPAQKELAIELWMLLTRTLVADAPIFSLNGGAYENQTDEETK